jgi:hypothetical protein
MVVVALASSALMPVVIAAADLSLLALPALGILRNWTARQPGQVSRLFGGQPSRAEH